MISKIITTSILASNIIFLGILFLYFFDKDIRNKIIFYINTYILHLIVLITGGSVVGSLIYSNILNFSPCVLCWYQRIVIYPQFIISIMALKKNDKNIVNYLLTFSIIGFLISLYQWLSNFTGKSLLPCTASGGECSRIYVIDYGYITIPFMALSVFIYLTFISLIYLKNKNNLDSDMKV